MITVYGRGVAKNFVNFRATKKVLNTLQILYSVIANIKKYLNKIKYIQLYNVLDPTLFTNVWWL